MKVESEWSTHSISHGFLSVEKTLEDFDGLWASPGSPYKSFDGMLKGIEFARRRDWPYLGTCAGFQYAFIGMLPATCSTHQRRRERPRIIPDRRTSSSIPVACAVPDCPATRPNCIGKVPEIRLRPGSYLQTFYGKDTGNRDRGILLQLRDQSRFRVGRHGGRIPRGRQRGR